LRESRKQIEEESKELDLTIQQLETERKVMETKLTELKKAVAEHTEQIKLLRERQQQLLSPKQKPELIKDIFNSSNGVIAASLELLKNSYSKK
jgi:hypothetical protein